ncbi:hypothetical protein Pfo_024378 [Paulownia fortunei]|nr:hypothetical protein Pfo_024378 [Paulownia fortunei]
MSQVDSRNSSAAKRARTDGGRREDDWTCPSCGNVNFSFRTTCNMRNCTQPRPADHNSKFAVKPMQVPQGYSSAAPYLGSGAPSSMYMGVPPYGSSLFNGTSMPTYDMPFSGGSAYHYNYGSRGMYGVPPLMDRYGMGLPMSPAMGPRSGFFPDEKSQKKASDGTRDNDWSCPKCGNVNFSFRTVCNMRKCNTPKPGSQGAKSGKNSNMPEGSWKCEKCNNINYPFRTKCNRQNCGADKPSETTKSPPEAADENDQVCCVIFLYCMTLPLELFISLGPLYLCNEKNSINTQSFNLCVRIYFSWQLLILFFFDSLSACLCISFLNFVCAFSFINSCCLMFQ